MNKILFISDNTPANIQKATLKKVCQPPVALANKVNKTIVDKFEKLLPLEECEKSNLTFRKEILKFYPEDEEKMSNMGIYQKIAYRRKLKDENRYIIVEKIEKC